MMFVREDRVSAFDTAKKLYQYGADIAHGTHGRRKSMSDPRSWWQQQTHAHASRTDHRFIGDPVKPELRSKGELLAKLRVTWNC